MDDPPSFYVKILDCRIKLINIMKYELDKFMFHILEPLFYSKHKNRFISFTQSNSEISLFIDTDSISEKFAELLRSNNIVSVMSTCNYRVLQIYEQESGIDHIGIINNISYILTAHNIPILYVNSYNNNFVVIEEKYFADGLLILKRENFAFMGNEQYNDDDDDDDL